MVQLQSPPFVYMNGGIIRWDEATVHIGIEAVTRGISVFEGVKGYWTEEGEAFRLLALEEHFHRLCRSAALQHLPFSMPFAEFRDACLELVTLLLTRDRDLWLRPTLLAVEGHWGEDTVSDLVITAYTQAKGRPEPMDVGFSTWQKAGDAAIPARVKSSANYQTARLARIEGRARGFSDMILFNPWGRVAEATGSCVLMVRDGGVATPPPWEGCLESITVGIVEGLCGTLDILFERRPVERTELLVADELALVGTLMEMGVVRRLDTCTMPVDTPVLDRISNEFWACTRGRKEHPAVRMTPVPGGGLVR
jgi:branched-chain amino acid aminotransferase